MANYNLTDQPISSSFEQILQKNTDTGELVNGVGVVVGDLIMTSSNALTASRLEGNAEQVSHVDFLVGGDTAIEQRMSWNDTDGTLNLGLKGGNVTLQVGQELVTRAVNKSGVDLLEANYQVVKVLGAQGNRLSVDLALADADINSASTLGLVTETIPNNQEGFITTEGLVRGIDTTGDLQLEVWNEGDILYLSGTTPGGITNVKPDSPTHLVTLGYVVTKNPSNGSIFVKVNNGYELEELHDVLITTPTAGDVLKYNGNGLWENASSQEITGSFASTGSNTFDGDQVISGSVTIQDTNAPMSGLVLKNNSGGGDVQIIPEGDFITTFNGASITGITNYGGSTISGSWGTVGDITGTGVGVSSTSEPTVLRIGTYETFEASTTGETRIFGDTIKLQPSSSAGTSVQVTGDVSASVFTGSFVGSFVGDGSQLTFGGTNLVSGSSQITDGSGLLSSSVTDFNTYSASVDSRIDAGLTINTGSFATTGSNTFTGDQFFGTYNLNGIGTIGTANANVSNVLAVTQSQESTIGTIVLSYPYTGSQGSPGQVTQKFSTYEGGSQFDQQINGVDFSYFKANQGGIIFETIGSGEIKFFSANDTVFGPTGNFKSTKILDGEIPALVDNSQADSLTISSYTSDNGTTYANNTWGFSNYPSSGYNQAFLAGKWNSAYNKGTEFSVNELKVAMTVGNGDYDYDEINIVDNNDGSSTINLKADNVDVNGSFNINGNQIVNGTNVAPASTLDVKDGNGTPRLQVNNATLKGLTGVDVVLNGNGLVGGNLDFPAPGQVINIAQGTVEAGEVVTPALLVDTIQPNNASAITLNSSVIASGSITGSSTTDISMRVGRFETIQANGYEPGENQDTIGFNSIVNVVRTLSVDGDFNNVPETTLNVKDGDGTSRLQVNNATLSGLTSVDVNINGKTQITDTLTLQGDEIINGSNVAPSQTFTANDGNGTPRLQVNNATLSGLTGVDVLLNGNTNINGQIILPNLGDYVDDAAAATGGVPVNGVYRTGSVLKIRVA